MPNAFVLEVIDHLIKPKELYQISDLSLKGFALIASKEDQKYAGLLQKPLREDNRNKFGANPVKPYRDYYGDFKLQTKLLTGTLIVKFAIGYTFNTKVVTVDDYSKFSWLRLATGIPDYLYPNLAHQKQLLDYLLAHSKQPKVVVTRVYHYLQFELLQQIMDEIIKREAIGKIES